MPQNYRGVAFLLSLGSLPIACNNDDKDPTGGTNSMTGTNPTGNTGTDSGTTDGSVTSTTDPTASGTSTTGAPTTGPLDTGATEPQMTTFLTTNTQTGFDTDDTGGPPPATDPVCIAYGAHVVECFPMYASYQEYLAQACEYYKAYGLRVDGQTCADAFDALFVCLSQVDCAEFGNPDATPCMAEEAALTAACPSIETGGETDTDGPGSTGGSDTSTG